MAAATVTALLARRQFIRKALSLQLTQSMASRNRPETPNPLLTTGNATFGSRAF